MLYTLRTGYEWSILGLCYDTALNEAESPVNTWVQVLGSYL